MPASIAVGKRVKARSRIFGVDWAKEKYGTGPTGWTTRWEQGVVQSAEGHHLWLVQFDDGDKKTLRSRDLQVCAAPGVQYDEDDPDQFDEDINENDADVDEERIATESDGSDSEDDTPLAALRHGQRAGKVLTWQPAASDTKSSPIEWTVGEVKVDAQFAAVDAQFNRTIFPNMTGQITEETFYTRLNPEYVHMEDFLRFRNAAGAQLFGDQWIELTKERQRIYDGLMLSMCLNPIGNSERYWATKPRGANPPPDYGRFMTRDQFKMIRTVQKVLVDPETADKDNIWWKSDAFVQQYNEIRIAEVVPGSKIVVDETMLLDDCEEDPTGESAPSFVAFVERKPHARGIELKNSADVNSKVVLRIEIVKVSH